VSQINGTSNYFVDHSDMSQVSSSNGNAVPPLADIPSRVANVTVEPVVQSNSAVISETPKTNRATRTAASTQKGRKTRSPASKPAGKKAKSLQNAEEQEEQMGAQGSNQEGAEPHGKRLRREDVDSSEESRSPTSDDDCVLLDEEGDISEQDEEDEEDDEDMSAFEVDLESIYALMNKNAAQFKKLKSIIKKQCKKMVQYQSDLGEMKRALDKSNKRCEELEKELIAARSKSDYCEPEKSKIPPDHKSKALYKRIMSKAGLSVKREPAHSEVIPSSSKRNPNTEY